MTHSLNTHIFVECDNHALVRSSDLVVISLLDVKLVCLLTAWFSHRAERFPFWTAIPDQINISGQITFHMQALRRWLHWRIVWKPQQHARPPVRLTHPVYSATFLFFHHPELLSHYCFVNGVCDLNKASQVIHFVMWIWIVSVKCGKLGYVPFVFVIVKRRWCRNPT